MLDTQQAHSVLASIMEQRKAKQGKVLKYKLHYTNRLGEVDGTLSGCTIPEMKSQFKEVGGSYRYAFITNLSGEKLFAGLDRQLSSKWVHYNRSKKK